MARRVNGWSRPSSLSCVDTWLDPACAFWTATDPVAASATSGAMRPSVASNPGCLTCWFGISGNRYDRAENRGAGRCSRSQRAVRDALLRAGAQWGAQQTRRCALWPSRAYVRTMLATTQHGRALAATRTAGVGSA